MSRMDAIANEYRKTKEGNSGKYDYVDVRALERAGISQYKMKDTNFIRIISPKFSKYPADQLPYYGKEVFYHSNTGPDGRTYVCLRRMLNERCPICEYADQIRAVNENDVRLKELWPSRRYLYFIYDVQNEETERLGLHWFDSPVTVKNNITTLSRDRSTGQLLDVSDRENGRDIIFERLGKGMTGTSYEGFELKNNAPPPKEWYDGAPDDFDTFILYPTYEQLAAAIGVDAAETVPQKAINAPQTDSQEETGTVQDPPVRQRGVAEAVPTPQPEPQAEGRPVQDPPVRSRSDVQEVPTRQRGVPSEAPAPSQDSAPEPVADGKAAVLNRIEQLRNMAKGGNS